MWDDNDGRRLAAAMEAAGFPVAGRGPAHVRFGWPGSAEGRGNLMVPLDGDAPEFAELLAAVKTALSLAARRGEAARHALDLRCGEVTG